MNQRTMTFKAIMVIGGLVA